MARQALALDPLGVTRYSYLARILIGGGRYDEAEGALRKAVALQPAASRVHVHLAAIDVLRGNATGALQNAQLEPPGSWRDSRSLWRSRRRAIGPRPMLLCKS